MRTRENQQSRTLDELCSIAFGLIRSTPVSIATDPKPALYGVVSSRRCPRASPTAIASLLMRVSLTLMLCGSVTFFVGFFLMPWVIGMVMVLYGVAIVTNISGIGKSILFPQLSSGLQCESPPKDMPECGMRPKAIERPECGIAEKSRALFFETCHMYSLDKWLRSLENKTNAFSTLLSYHLMSRLPYL